MVRFDRTLRLLAPVPEGQPSTNGSRINEFQAGYFGHEMRLMRVVYSSIREKIRGRP